MHFALFAATISEGDSHNDWTNHSRNKGQIPECTDWMELIFPLL
jgi:hypothetical protein